jgi:hypothetical protein
MKKSTTAALFINLLAVLLLGSACLGLHIREGIRNADPYFDRARSEIQRIQAKDPGRHGAVHRLCVLVHDRQSNDLVEVSTPLWLAEACLGVGLSAAEHDRESGLQDFSERYGLDLRSLKDLDRLGPGLLIEIEDEDSRVLVWLK